MHSLYKKEVNLSAVQSHNTVLSMLDQNDRAPPWQTIYEININYFCAKYCINIVAHLCKFMIYSRKFITGMSIYAKAL